MTDPRGTAADSPGRQAGPTRVAPQNLEVQPTDCPIARRCSRAPTMSGAAGGLQHGSCAQTIQFCAVF